MSSLVGLPGILLEFALAVATYIALQFMKAPYGRYSRPGWGVLVPARVGWIVMESPAVVLFVVVFLLGAHRNEPAPIVLLLIWQSHYVYRTLIYPFLMRPGSRMSLGAMLAAFIFQLLNATINAHWLSAGGHYPARWLLDPRFIAGGLLFAAGYATHVTADRALRRLRAPGETGYKIPHGGLYRWVSCPNYLGEIVEWCGFALAAWSPAGLAFAAYTFANVAPRAIQHHAWYRERFADYPPERRALIPCLW
jgi:protein-S-isoprenylcysteine O-methyltransferase Ste14